MKAMQIVNEFEGIRMLKESASNHSLPEAVTGLTIKSSVANDATKVQRCSVAEIFQNHLMQNMVNADLDQENNALFVADLGEVVRQYQQWVSMLPRVEPFYAIKCNPDPMVLKTLFKLGVGFDCASKAEIAQVLAIGTDPSRIIFANPCKQNAHLRFASTHGVNLMTFDNADELHKIQAHCPLAKLVLRILVDDSKSVCKFGVKFGASMQATGSLLETARKLNLDVVGVSFHVGSGCYDESAFVEAVSRARAVFDQAREFGYTFTLLDIGGGFPGAKSRTGVGAAEHGITFASIAGVLGPAIEHHFPKSSGVRIIAEPGRYFVHSAYTLACSVIARRVVTRDLSSSPQLSNTVNGPIASNDDQPSFMYYINDGVYGSFNCILFDHVKVTALPLLRQGSGVTECAVEPLYDCSIWGPTCDSMDCVTKSGELPKMEIGDWLMFECMGAYTMCAASEFNGFTKPKTVYTSTLNV